MIGEPARAAMLEALLGGQALPAGELAKRARVAPATASAHLTRLVDGGLLTRTRSGRHRYFALASAEVADVLEALALVGSAPGAAPAPEVAPNGSFRFARTCYDHLAGVLGVRVTERLIEQRYIVGREEYELTPAGDTWLASLAVDVDAVRSARRVVARPCLDWTERRPHLAGGAGAAIASMMFERRWLTRVDGTRAVRLTLRGREGLVRTLGVEVTTG